jgi:hypothetical protein
MVEHVLMASNMVVLVSIRKTLGNIRFSNSTQRENRCESIRYSCSMRNVKEKVSSFLIRCDSILSSLSHKFEKKNEKKKKKNFQSEADLGARERGAFLVRPSSKKDGCLALSVHTADSGVQHTVVRADADGWHVKIGTVQSAGYKTILALVCFQLIVLFSKCSTFSRASFSSSFSMAM